MLQFIKNFYPEIDSTSDQLIRIGKNGAPEGTLIIADKQHKGRGQENNHWESEKGGLYFSFLLRPQKLMSLLTMLTGNVLLTTLKSFTNLDFRIKWPNDLFFEKKKIAGILTESFFNGNKIDFVVIGCGINLNQESFPTMEKNTPTSLKILTGKNTEKEEFLNYFLTEFSKSYDLYQQGDYQRIIDTHQHYSCLIGKEIKVSLTSGLIISGRALAIDPEGFLILENSGKKERIISGRVISF